MKNQNLSTSMSVAALLMSSGLALAQSAVYSCSPAPQPGQGSIRGGGAEAFSGLHFHHQNDLEWRFLPLNSDPVTGSVVAAYAASASSFVYRDGYYCEHRGEEADPQRTSLLYLQNDNPATWSGLIASGCVGTTAQIDVLQTGSAQFIPNYWRVCGLSEANCQSDVQVCHNGASVHANGGLILASYQDLYEYNLTYENENGQ